MLQDDPGRVRCGALVDRAVIMVQDSRRLIQRPGQPAQGLPGRRPPDAASAAAAQPGRADSGQRPLCGLPAATVPSCGGNLALPNKRLTQGQISVEIMRRILDHATAAVQPYIRQFFNVMAPGLGPDSRKSSTCS